MLWNMAASDVSKSVELEFTETVYLKDGYIIAKDAPFGAYLDAEIMYDHPTYGWIVVASFARKVPIFGTGWFPLDSEDRGEIQQGMKLRLTIYNSDNSDGIQDPAADFKAAGRLEMFRASTV
jgi:hypothetical protein